MEISLHRKPIILPNTNIHPITNSPKATLLNDPRSMMNASPYENSRVANRGRHDIILREVSSLKNLSYKGGRTRQNVPTLLGQNSLNKIPKGPKAHTTSEFYAPHSYNPTKTSDNALYAVAQILRNQEATHNVGWDGLGNNFNRNITTC